ncbi:MAG: Ig-like domain-containing protein [Ruminococcus sp.]|jgi:uncharacterized protein YjdB|nr:Ig-like domain-containing protein [Ruminococcus sp.]
MKIKKIISAVLAAVVMLSLGISASAETMFDVAKTAKLGTTYKTVLTDDYMDNTFKFTVSSDTTITINFETDINTSYYYLYNSDGKEMSSKNFKESSGDMYSSQINWNSKTEFAKVSCDYSLMKGTYYLQVKKGYGGGNIMRFKITDPNAKSVTALSLSITVDVGDTLDLGGVVSPSNSKITWKSSDTEVATVSADGTVEAIAAGTAKITATAGGKTASITIIVN